MNALAFPSVRHPSIGLGNALVELLEPDEVAAIYAHELSHIEQYSRRKVRRLQALNRALIVIAVLAPYDRVEVRAIRRLPGPVGMAGSARRHDDLAEPPAKGARDGK
jgi:Zn-dependent protease with chaperone function